MRTTITLDPDVAALLEREMRSRGIRLKQAVNDALRRQLGGGGARPPLALPTRDLGRPSFDIDRADAFADALETDEVVRKLQQGR